MKAKIPSHISFLVLVLGIFGFLGKKRKSGSEKSEMLELKKGEKHIAKLNKLIQLISELEDRKKALIEKTATAVLHVRHEHYNKARSLFVQVSNLMQEDDLYLEDILDNYYEKNLQLKSWMDANQKLLRKVSPYFPQAITETIFRTQKRMQKVTSDNFVDELTNYLLAKDGDKSHIINVYSELRNLNKVSLKNNFETFIMDQNEEIKILEAIIDREKNNSDADTGPEDKKIREKKISILSKQRDKIKDILSKLEMYLAILEKQNIVIDRTLLSLRAATFNIGGLACQESLNQASKELSATLKEDELPFINDLKKDHEILTELNQVFESMENIEKNN